VLVPVAAALVGIAIVLAVGAFYLAQPPLTPPGNLTLTLQTPYFAGFAATVPIAYASVATSPQSFLVNLAVNGTAGMAVPMPTTSGIGAGVVLSPLGYSFRIDWSDVDYDGKVSTYDTFTITPTWGPPPCCLYETFYILWQADGSLVAQISFYAQAPPSTIPTVQLGTTSRGTATNVYVPVIDVAPTASPAYFRFQLVIDTNWSQPTPLWTNGSGAPNVSLDGGAYIVAWYDYGYDGLLDAGDAFNITMITGTWPPSGTFMAFYLEWEDGTVLAVASWAA